MRHFTVNPSVSDNGNHIGGLVGFLKGLQLLVDNLAPSAIIVIWEGGGSVRRRNIFPEYKNKRRPVKLNRFYEDDIPDTIENRNYQINLLINFLKLSGVKQIYVSDCEADDVIGYSAKYILKESKVTIISSDKDYYQLIDGKRISQWSPGQKDFVTLEKILKKFFIPAHNFCVARCFTGDGSDGLPGIKGAGFRTLAKRFPELTTEEFVSVEEIINLSLIRSQESNVKIFQNILDSAEIAKRNWRLMYLDVVNLSGSQIQKIENQFDTSGTTPNKIKFMKLMIREGVKNFNSDIFLMTISSIRS
jgi:5'-3' exonuclease